MQVWLTGLTVSLIAATLIWLLSVKMQDVSIVDRIWGMLFLILFGSYLYAAETSISASQILALCLVCIWALRLSIYIHSRNHGKAEDYRYQRMRESNPKHFWWRSLFTVFWLQAGLANLIAAPLFYIATHPDSDLGMIYFIPVLMWLIGFVFEAGGDWQLARFKADPSNKGKVMNRGLWSLTRHPNYFGDSLQWWAYWAFAVIVGGWYTFYGPVIMTYFLLQVSGVKMLEKDMSNRSDEYKSYMRNTPSFIPWPKFLRRTNILSTIFAAMFFCNSLHDYAYAATNLPDVGEFYNSANLANMKEKVEGFYHEQVEFQDPIAKISGRQALLGHYENLYKNVKKISFKMGTPIVQDQNLAVNWAMHMEHPDINSGKEIVVLGISEIHFEDGKAIFHRDYFDMGEMLYEHIFGIGSVIRWIKAKLQ